jgi:hypothetical protein
MAGSSVIIVAKTAMPTSSAVRNAGSVRVFMVWALTAASGQRVWPNS